MITAKKILTHPLHCLAFGLGSGLSPKMPGTMGTVVGVLLYLLLAKIPLSYYLISVGLLTLVAIWICDWSSKDLGIHDYPGIVLDEIVGFLWVMIAVPLTWWTVLLAFIFFRLFDIWKPWPIRWLDQRVTGGFGIVIDDCLAAVYAWLLIQFILILMR